MSRIKSNEIMKFGQLLEYNMRNIFAEKSYTKCGGETIPRPFSKRLKLSIFLDQESKVLYSLFLSYAKLRTSKYTETKLQTICFYLIQYFFKKRKEVWNWYPCLTFCMVFEEKYFYC